MTNKMTPRRWLGSTLGVAGAYLIYLLASAADGVWNVPTQIHSVILTALAVAILLAAAGWYGATLLTTIRQDLAMLAPTQQLPILRVVGTAGVPSPDAGRIYTQAYLDGLSAQPDADATVLPLTRRP